MTNITTLDKLLQTKGEELLEGKGFVKTHSSVFGSVWKNNDTNVDVELMPSPEHKNAILWIPAYLDVRINGNPTLCDSIEDVEKLLITL